MPLTAARPTAVPRSATTMVDYNRESQLLLLQTVDEESETEDDDMQDDVRSNSSTLKSTSQRAGCRERQGAVAVVMTESTDSGLESDKNVDTELAPQNNSSQHRRNENLLYHCQVGTCLS